MLFCFSCKKEIEPKVEEKIFANATKHLSASCPDCGRWLKYLPQEIEPAEYIMPFGKHQGKKLGEIESPYLEWIVKSDLKPRIKKLAQDVLNDRIIDKLFEPAGGISEDEKEYKTQWADHDKYSAKNN